MQPPATFWLRDLLLNKPSARLTRSWSLPPRHLGAARRSGVGDSRSKSAYEQHFPSFAHSQPAADYAQRRRFFGLHSREFGQRGRSLFYLFFSPRCAFLQPPANPWCVETLPLPPRAGARGGSWSPFMGGHQFPPCIWAQGEPCQLPHVWLPPCEL